MNTYPAPLARLIQELSKLPGIGEKSAARLAFHLLKGNLEDVASLADSIGNLSHLHACDTTLALVSRAPFASIQRFRERMGWAVPWYSSYGSDFNYDFHVSFDESKVPLEYNYKDKLTLEREAPYIRSGTDGPGVSVFLREGDQIFHTYSAYQRGLDSLLGTYHWLELTPLGRQRHVIEFPYHDTCDGGS